MPANFSLADIDFITFDCYGTLIDWETGILNAVRPVLSARGVAGVANDEIIRVYAQLEREIEAAANPTGSDAPGLRAGQSDRFMAYRDVLRRVMAGIGDHFGLALEERELDRLPESMQRWKPFADVPGALANLARHAGLVITSNVDDDLFAFAHEQLTDGSWDFARVVTAQMCRSYKPYPRHWRVAFTLLDTTPDRVLHVAESVYHDVVPARAMGMRTAWINRRGERGPGASGGARASDAAGDAATPDVECRTLAELARILGAS
ncbi:MAG: HAD-IA family hydrolase [Planctomycetota bacterium]|nr:HAD-IA family hydrolase [Planctomycetota bacterium]